MCLKGGSGISNRVDPDQTSRSLTFHLGLHSLHRSVCPNILCSYGMETWHMVLAYVPYLTLRDKISQNLVHPEGNFHKKNQISQNFQTILQQILERNKHKSHTIVVFTSLLHERKDFRLYSGSYEVMFKRISQNFVNSPLKFCPLSLSLRYLFMDTCLSICCTRFS